MVDLLIDSLDLNTPLYGGVSVYLNDVVVCSLGPVAEKDLIVENEGSGDFLTPEF
jgi:hypothetical protein